MEKNSNLSMANNIKYAALFFIPAYLVLLLFREMASSNDQPALLYLGIGTVGTLITAGVLRWLRPRLNSLTSTSAKIWTAMPVMSATLSIPYLLSIGELGWPLALTTMLFFAFWSALLIWLRGSDQGLLRKIAIGAPLALLPFAVLAGLLLIVNLPVFDEPLDPEISSILDEKLTAQELPDNGYDYLAGLLAPADVSPLDWGRRITAVHRQVQDEIIAGKASTLPADLHQGEMAFTALPACQQWGKCKAQAEKKPESLQAFLKSNAILEARCNTLVRLPNWGESFIFNHPNAPSPKLHLKVCRSLRFSASALALENGSVGTVMTNLLNDLAFARKMLEQTQSLFEKRDANVMAGATLIQIAELLKRQPSLAREFEPALRATLTPLNHAELTLTTSLRHELKVNIDYSFFMNRDISAGLYGFEVYPFPVQRYLTQLMQSNASLNLGYRLLWKPMLHHEAVAWRATPPEHAQQLQALNAFQERPFFQFYNPIGQYFNKGTTSLEDHFKPSHHMHDLDGLFRLVALQSRLLLRTRDEASIQQLLAEEKSLYDPYTEQPMVFDTRLRTITFTTRAPDICGWWYSSTSSEHSPVDNIAIALD